MFDAENDVLLKPGVTLQSTNENERENSSAFVRSMAAIRDTIARDLSVVYSIDWESPNNI